MGNESLYEVLGIPKKTNNKKAIRNAYISKSKTDHSDAGGEPEKFKLVAKAYQILKDDENRKKYDNGESVDQILTPNNNKAYTILSTILCGVIEGADPTTQDIIELVEQNINVNIAEIQSKIAKAAKEQSNYETFLKKVKKKKKKKGSAFMIDVAKTQIEGKKETISKLKSEKESYEEAKEINQNYCYEADPVVASNLMWSSFTATGGF